MAEPIEAFGPVGRAGHAGPGSLRAATVADALPPVASHMAGEQAPQVSPLQDLDRGRHGGAVGSGIVQQTGQRKHPSGAKSAIDGQEARPKRIGNDRFLQRRVAIGDAEHRGHQRGFAHGLRHAGDEAAEALLRLLGRFRRCARAAPDVRRRGGADRDAVRRARPPGIWRG
jgi:hypothetical protein